MLLTVLIEFTYVSEGNVAENTVISRLRTITHKYKLSTP